MAVPIHIKRRMITLLMACSVVVGIGIGFYAGDFFRETKMPGDALCTSDATGHWVKRNAANQVVDNATITNTHMRLILQAIPSYALLHGGNLPETLEVLVSSGLVGKEILLDGWGQPIRYQLDETHTRYTLHSLGADGVLSCDDIPHN